MTSSIRCLILIEKHDFKSILGCGKLSKPKLIKEDIEHWIQKAAENVKGIHSADGYFYGFRNGCYALLDYLISAGVIEP
jgi:hypothetical protein